MNDRDKRPGEDGAGPATPAAAEGDAAPGAPERNERIVRERFWPKLRRVIGAVPFVEDLVAAWFCALDPETPARVRGLLLAALVYFILPLDLIPDFILKLGFTDDATVLATVLAVVGGHIQDRHRARAAEALGREFPHRDGKGDGKGA